MPVACSRAMAVANGRRAQIFKLCFLIPNSPSLERRAQSRSRFSGESQRRQTAPGWRRLGFGELCADAKTGRLLSAGLLCDDASNLIHLSACAIDNDHAVHQVEDAEYYHPIKIEIIFEIGDALCRKLGDHPFAQRRNRGSLLG
jgi:hypothetical protein